jgi:hypothetical protein
LVSVLSLYNSEAFTEAQLRRLEIIAPHLATSLAATDQDRSRGGSELRIVARR